MSVETKKPLVCDVTRWTYGNSPLMLESGGLIALSAPSFAIRADGSINERSKGDYETVFI